MNDEHVMFFIIASDILAKVIKTLIERKVLEWRHLLILIRSNLRKLDLGPVLDLLLYNGATWNDLPALIEERAQVIHLKSNFRVNKMHKLL